VIEIALDGPESIETDCLRKEFHPFAEKAITIAIPGVIE
jgi:hypothetical protein